MKNWLRDELKPEAEAVFDPAHLGRHDFLDEGGVARLWREHCDGAANHAHLLFALLMFDFWHAEVLEAAPAGAGNP